MQTISDVQLRTSLAKFMEDVPPVTDSTRDVLMSKLKKFLDETESPDPLENLESKAMNNLPEKHVKELPTTGPTNVFSSSRKRSGREGLNSAHSESPVKPTVIKSSTPSNLKSSPVFEYAQRLPSYRRRSIHPDRPLLDDPYSDLDLPVSPETLSSKSRRPLSKQWSDKSNKQTSFLMHCSYVVLKSIQDTVYYLADHIKAQRLPLRQYSYFAILLIFLIMMAWFLLGDPFYHNPVKDLRGFVKIPNL